MIIDRGRIVREGAPSGLLGPAGVVVRTAGLARFDRLARGEGWRIDRRIRKSDSSSDGWLTLGGGAFHGALFGALGAATRSVVRKQVVAIANGSSSRRSWST